MPLHVPGVGPARWNNVYNKLQNMTPGEMRNVYKHDPRKVRVIAKNINVRDKSFNYTTAFAGKRFCIDDYLRGMKTLPLGEAHATFYDNSNNKKFQKDLLEILNDNFESWCLIEDANQQYTVETTDEYAAISLRCHCIYKTIMENAICKELPLTLNVEDDVEIPDDAWWKMTSALETYPEAGTVIGSCSSRRLNDATWSMPIVFTYRKVVELGGSEETKFYECRASHYKEFGLEAVGSGHMGCWLTRTDLINELGMSFGIPGVMANDACWGVTLNEHGYKFLVDWSVRTKHYGVVDGQKVYYDHGQSFTCDDPAGFDLGIFNHKTNGNAEANLNRHKLASRRTEQELCV